MKTAITIDELRQMTATDVASLSRPLPVKNGNETIAVIAPVAHPNVVEDPEKAARLKELVMLSREMAQRRTPLETAELELWLEERER